jgi:hypothetical protein
MISTALQKFYDMTRKDPVLDINGKTYKRPGYSAVHEPLVTCLDTHTLQGIVEAVELQFEPDINYEYHIHIASPTEVLLETQAFGPFHQRHIIIKAEAYVTNFLFGNEYEVEQFIIALNSQFILNKDRNALLQLASKITKETSGTVSDNGISQKMEVKQGVSMRDKVEVKNPFILKPYRTFPEIEQPASEFVFRVRDNQGVVTCALYEADGSKWKIEAIDRIKGFFKEKLNKKGFPDMPVIA